MEQIRGPLFTCFSLDPLLEANTSLKQTNFNMTAPKELRRYEYVILFGAPHQQQVSVFKLSHDDYKMLKSEEGFEPSVPANVYGLLHYDVPLIQMMNALGKLGFHVISAVDDEENAYIMERLSGNGNCTTCSCSCQRDILTENTNHWLHWFLL